ncbi:hypothetical protein [Fastidiosibacter lacustris]|uniref:hypothetical protein n=1 Tax=Fastidiosibacter lacustris TaxID=2056695 RepID=UPI000E3531D4|nr:hypothetical protein [Fastidiosibacter lacustris]
MSQETITNISIQSTATSDPQSLLGISIALVIMVIIFYIFSIAFSFSVYKLLKAIPSDKKISPPWLAWMLFIPIVGYIFQWIVLPFGVGNALKKYQEMEIKLRGDTLFILGLILVILPIVSLIPMTFPFTAITGVIIYIIYWVKIVQVRKIILKTTTTDSAEQ